MALILMLLATLVLSSLIVLFFTLAAKDRTNSNSYAHGMKTSELATGGLELVIGKIRDEIADPTRSAAAEDPSDLGPTIYTPLQASYILPDNTVSGTSSTPSNLIKMSHSTLPISGLISGTSLASNASTATPSRNGRSITATRWSKPALFDFDATNSAVPEWIYLARTGPVVNPAFPAASQGDSGNLVVGRIAFAVYDVGGLLDVNVAGYPSTLPPEEVGRKGSPAFARLESLGLDSTQAAAIVDFRNSLSKSSFLTYVGDSDKHKGFTKTVSGDNRFLSRQEFLRFARNYQFSPNELSLLTIFSREKNAPSYAPNPGLPVATVDSGINVSLATARHKNTGRLLFEKRFPLSRLNLFQDPSVNAADILKYFGLTYVPASRSFTYKAASIQTLPQLENADAYPEVDFFEALKAVIYQGSVGQSAGTTASVSDDPNKDTQIMQIGANIIDQYDLDPDRDDSVPPKPIPIPTTILFAGKTLYGLENLPYVNKIHFLGEKAIVPAGKEADNLKIGVNNGTIETDDYSILVAAELWNPNFQRMPNTDDTEPTIQATVTGETQVTLYELNTAELPGDIHEGPTTNIGADLTRSKRTFSVNQQFPTQATANFAYFAEPRHVRLSAALPTFTFNKTPKNPIAPYTWCFKSARINITKPVSVELAVLDENDIPRVYQKTLETALPSLKISHVSTPPNFWSAGRVDAGSSFAHSDPRTNRLGYFGLNYRSASSNPKPPNPPQPQEGSLPQFYTTSFAGNHTSPYSLRPMFGKAPFNRLGDPDGYGVRTTDGIPAAGFSPLSTGLFLGLLWENTRAATQARDPDLTNRMGDGGFAPDDAPVPMEPIHPTSQPTTPWPTISNRPAGTNCSRPVVLDRPFRTIADLGYVHRDSPWRSLNFSSTDSADAGLLDVFSIDDASVTAGRVNLNTPHQDVLKAILAGSLKEENGPATAILQDTEAATAVTAITSTTASAPFKNISEFVTRFSTPANITQSMLGNNSTGFPSRAIKTERESLIRALSGSTQTRTWNLMIDLVAQTGRFPRDAANLDGFVVEAEQRYWLHIAIDRYTGEIVDEMIEQVIE